MKSELTGNPSRSLNIIYLIHLILLFLGWTVGCIAAYYFNLIEFDFSRELQKARNLGITSITILSGYPKSKDTLTYVTTLVSPVIFSIGLWYPWARKHREQLKSIFPHNDYVNTAKDRKWVASLILIICFYLLASFNINGFYMPGWNSYVGAWIFLGEDGENLAWAQSILSGGVYGKDFYCLYGPMMIYPLVWAMKIFGTSVLVERSFRYFLDLIAFSIIIFFLYKTMKSKTLFILLSVVFLLIFPAFKTYSINFTYLRFIFGILPLLLLYFYFGSGKRYLLFFTGVTVVQSILFSQEAGFCSMISIIATYLIYSFSGNTLKASFRESLLFFTGCLVSAAPMLIYLSSKGALIPFYESLYGFPKLSVLGYGGTPAPSFKEFIESPFGYSFYFYWVIFSYGFASIYLASLVLLGRTGRDNLLKISLLIFGILLFMVPVRRCSDENIYKVFVPCIILIFLFIDTAIRGITTRRNFHRVGHFIIASLILLSTFVLFITTNYLKTTIEHSHVILFKHKWSRISTGYEIPSIQRGRITFDLDTAKNITQLSGFLNTYTKKKDYVYFFPQEAAYYFLFDRNNPTRYAISYFAITHSQRMELIADLEKNKPFYVIYSKKTWRVDGISEEIQVPEVVEYIKAKYKPLLDMGDILIMNRAAP